LKSYQLIDQWAQSRFAETLTLTLNPNFGESGFGETGFGESGRLDCDGWMDRYG